MVDGLGLRHCLVSKSSDVCIRSGANGEPGEIGGVVEGVLPSGQDDSEAFRGDVGD